MDRRARLHGLDKFQPIAATVAVVHATDPGEVQKQALTALDTLLPHLTTPTL